MLKNCTPLLKNAAFPQEISEMQCLIEELQSQVLPSPEPQKSEGKEKGYVIGLF